MHTIPSFHDLGGISPKRKTVRGSLGIEHSVGLHKITTMPPVAKEITCTIYWFLTTCVFGGLFAWTHFHKEHRTNTELNIENYYFSPQQGDAHTHVISMSNKTHTTAQRIPHDITNVNV